MIPVKRDNPGSYTYSNRVSICVFFWSLNNFILDAHAHPSIPSNNLENAPR